MTHRFLRTAYTGAICVLVLSGALIASADPLQFTLGNFNRAGTNFPGSGDNSSTATEPSIAVGPLQVLVQSQGAVRAFTKDGTVVPAFSINGQASFSSNPYLFYGVTDDMTNPTFYVDAVGCGTESIGLSARDPVMMFDPIAQRFYALSWGYSHLNLNVSHSADLRDGWYNYHLRLGWDPEQPADTNPDRPSLGFTTDKIIISSSYWYGFVRVFDKAALLSGNIAQTEHTFVCGSVDNPHYDIALGAYQNVSTGTAWPRACANLSSDATGYLVGFDFGGGTKFKIGKLTGSPGSVQFQSVLSQTIVLLGPGGAQQKEEAGSWSLLDCFPRDAPGTLSNPFYRNDVSGRPGFITIATHQSVMGVNENELRVFEITAETADITTNETYTRSGVSYAFPAAVTDRDGNLYVGFNESNGGQDPEGQYPSCYVTCRKAGEGSLEFPPVLVKAGEGSYDGGPQSPSCNNQPNRRWGDFTGIALDECSPGNATAYTIGQWATADHTRLATWVSNVRFEETPPTSCADNFVNWHNMRLPSPTSSRPNGRWDASLIWDPANSRFVLFGGFDGTNYLNDVWSYSPSSNAWTQIATTGEPPSPRRRHTGIYDSARSRLLIFGGEDSDERFNDVRALSLSSNAWSAVATSGGPPSTRCSHAAVYDAGRDQMVIYGGVAYSPYTTWKLTFPGNQWTQIAQGNSPLAFEGCSAAYDPIGARMIIFGGRTYVGPGPLDLNETYTLSLVNPTAWTQMTPSGSTPPRAFASMTYIPQCQKVLVYGGIQDQSSSPCGQALEIGLSSVSSLSLSGSPAWSTAQATCYGPTPRGHQVSALTSDASGVYFFGGGERGAWGTACDPTYNNEMWRIGLPEVNPITNFAAYTDSVVGTGQYFDYQYKLKGSWTTSIPMTSQLEYRVSGAGTWSITPMNPGLQTGHYVTVSGLQAGTTYDVRPVSESAGWVQRGPTSTVTTEPAPIMISNFTLEQGIDLDNPPAHLVLAIGYTTSQNSSCSIRIRKHLTPPVQFSPSNAYERNTHGLTHEHNLSTIGSPPAFLQWNTEYDMVITVWPNNIPLGIDPTDPANEPIVGEDSQFPDGFGGYTATLVYIKFKTIKKDGTGGSEPEFTMETIDGRRLGIGAITQLLPNVPNPFSVQTNIQFSVKETAPVLLSIYDIQGRLVKTLVDEVVGEGFHQVTWDRRASTGQLVNPGIYFYRMLVDDFVDTKKMVVFR